MNGLLPRSPDDYVRLFTVTHLHGYPVFFRYDEDAPAQRATRPKRRLRSLALAVRRRREPEPTAVASHA